MNGETQRILAERLAPDPDSSASSTAWRNGAHLTAVGKGLVFKDAHGADECGALLALAWPQLVALGPPGELAVRRELQRLDLIA
jgi:hypothetical protein